MKQTFNLENEVKQQLIEEIKVYFDNERDEQLGDLAANFILEFFIEQLAPTFYNLGVEDAHIYMNEKLDDIFEIQK